MALGYFNLTHLQQRGWYGNMMLRATFDDGT